MWIYDKSFLKNESTYNKLCFKHRTDIWCYLFNVLFKKFLISNLLWLVYINKVTCSIWHCILHLWSIHLLILSICVDPFKFSKHTAMPSLNNDNFTSPMKVQISKKLRTPEAGQVQRKPHLRIRVKLLRTTFNKQVLMESQRGEDTSHPRRLGEQQMVFLKHNVGYEIIGKKSLRMVSTILPRPGYVVWWCGDQWWKPTYLKHSVSSVHANVNIWS